MRFRVLRYYAALKLSQIHYISFECLLFQILLNHLCLFCFFQYDMVQFYLQRYQLYRTIDDMFLSMQHITAEHHLRRQSMLLGFESFLDILCYQLRI